MKIIKIQINNFLQTNVPLILNFVDTNSNIGNILISQPNSWGKSTILNEINTFFKLLGGSKLQKFKTLKFFVRNSISTTIHYKLSGDDLLKFIKKYPDSNNDEYFGFITIKYGIDENTRLLINMYKLTMCELANLLDIEISNTKHVELFDNIGDIYELTNGLNVVSLNISYRESIDYILIKLQKFIKNNTSQLTKFEQIFNKICFPLIIEYVKDNFIFKRDSKPINQHSISLGELQILKILTEFFSINHIKNSLIMIDDLNRNLSKLRYTELLKFIQYDANQNDNQLIITETGENGNLIFTYE